MIPNRYTEKTITGQKITSGSLIFYQLLLNGRPVHLTFAREKHIQAAARLRHMAFVVSNGPPRRMSAAELAELLGRRCVFTQFSQSLLVKEATPFQQRVWGLICDIPRGSTKTYGDLAEKLGNRALARAVGQACNANPLALFIPCHRVVGRTGIGGFAGGPAIKKKLLELERGL